MAEYTLLIILFAPFLGSIALVFVSNRQALLVRGIAAGSAFISLFASFYLFYAYDPVKGGFQFLWRYVWSTQLGVSLYLGVDGIGTPLVLASSILLFAGIFVSWHVKDRTKEFYISLLILAAATIGVFMSLDLFFLYFFYEMSVIPMYLLLGIWGSHTKGYLEMSDPEGVKKRDSIGFIFNFGSNSKEYAAMKLVLFLSAGAVFALMGILLIYKFSGVNTFDILVLREQAKFSGFLADLIWILIFFGFASIAPIWPLHSWSPVGHAAAPAATSMLHAGVLMKLGHFSIIRVAFEILPETTRELMPIAAVLCVFSIIYGGLRRLLCKRYEIRDWVFQFQPHGVRLPRHGGAGLHQSERRRHIHVRPCHGHRHVLRHGRLGLRPNAYQGHSLPWAGCPTVCRLSPPFSSSRAWRQSACPAP